MRVASTIELGSELRTKLLRVAHSQTASVRLAKRCAIAPLCCWPTMGMLGSPSLTCWASGAFRLHAGPKRFGAGGMTDIEKDLPRGGRPADRSIEAKIVQLTTQSDRETPKDKTLHLIRLTTTRATSIPWCRSSWTSTRDFIGTSHLRRLLG